MIAQGIPLILETSRLNPKTLSKTKSKTDIRAQALTSQASKGTKFVIDLRDKNFDVV